MKTKLLFKIALKNLMSQRARTFLTISAVSVGVGAIVFLVSLGFGLEKLTVERVANFDALSIFDAQTGGSKLVNINSEAIEKIKSLANVSQAEPLFTAPGKIKYKGATTEMVLYSTTKDYLNLAGTKIAKGKVFRSNDASEILVNNSMITGLGENQDSVLGKKVTLSTFLDKDAAPNLADEKREVAADFIISGVIDDSGPAFVYMPFDTLKAMGMENAQTVKIKVSQKDKIQEVRKQVENMGYVTVYVGDTVAQITSFFQIFRIVLGLFGMIAVIVALLGMLNTLTISLMERTREVGLMKVLGMRRKGVRNLFLMEAALVGIFGGFLGVILGIAAAYLINLVLYIVARSTHNPVLEIFYFPLWFLAVVFLFSVIVALLTGLYPARRASKIEPLEALRYE